MNKLVNITSAFIIALLCMLSYAVLSVDGSRVSEYLCKEKHKDDPGYKIMAEEHVKGINAYVGTTDEKIFLDIYMKDEYWGGSKGNINSNSSQLDIFDYTGKQKIIIVWGIKKLSDYKKYKLTMQVGGDDSNNFETIKDISHRKYIVDIFILDGISDKMLYTPDLVMLK